MTRLAMLGFVLLGVEPVSAALSVVTTTTDLASLVVEIGGDRVKVQSICLGSQDPHFLRAKPTYALRLRKADLLVYIGLELEKAWLPLLIQGSRNPKLNPGKKGNLDASIGATILEIPEGTVDRSMGDVHPQGNPHYLLDPSNILVVAEAIAHRLTHIDPEGADYYSGQLGGFIDQFTEALNFWEFDAASLKGRKIVVYHREFVYLAHWLGLEIVEAVENIPGINPSPIHLSELQKRMKSQGIQVLLASTYSNRSVAKTVAERGGAKLLVLPVAPDPKGDIRNIFALFENAVKRLREAYLEGED